MSQSADNNHRGIPSIAHRKRLPPSFCRRLLLRCGGLWNAAAAFSPASESAALSPRSATMKHFLPVAFSSCLALGSLAVVTGMPLMPFSSLVAPAPVTAAEQPPALTPSGIRLQSPRFEVQQVNGSISQTPAGRRALAEFHREKTETPEQLDSAATMRIVPAPKVHSPQPHSGQPHSGQPHSGQPHSGHAEFGARDASDLRFTPRDTVAANRLGIAGGPQIQSSQAAQWQAQLTQRDAAFPARNGSSFTLPDSHFVPVVENPGANASTLRLPGFQQHSFSNPQTGPQTGPPVSGDSQNSLGKFENQLPGQSSPTGVLSHPTVSGPQLGNPYSSVPLPGTGPYGHHFQDESYRINSPDGGRVMPGPDASETVLQPVLEAPPFAQPMPMASSGNGPVSGYSAATGASPGTSGFRATVESDAPPLMSPYSARTNATVPQEQADPSVPQLPPVPADFVPWWDAVVQQSVGTSRSAVSVDVPALLQDAMRYSPQVIAIQTEPEVQYRVITQEAARFDWTAFLESKYNDLNDPVGNELTTGTGENRLLTRKYQGAAGVRGRNLLGGEFRLAQEIGHENQNSRFFIPNNQGQTRLELSYRQPLLDGAGRTYNESEIILARIQANTSEDEVVRLLQNHLIQITEAYWTLYRARAEFFQRQKLLNSSRQVLQRLEARTQVDTIPRQVLRARAAVARSQTRIQRTLARVRDAEAQLRLLVNSPSMLNGGPIELLPAEPPRLVTETADLQSVLQTSLINRPDISEAIRKMRASSVRLGVSRKELLPRLDFLVETYVADLSANSNIGRSMRGQFGDNRPGYTAGFEFEVPLENRAAIARHEQRQWELKRSINIFRATVEKSLTDVEIARREVSTAWSEIHSHYYALQAANQEAAYLRDRFDVLPASEDSAVLLLQDLLDSQERVADEEVAFVQAQVEHAVALVNLKKETGILLQSRHAAPDVQAPDQQWLDARVQSATDHAPLPDQGNSGGEPTGDNQHAPRMNTAPNAAQGAVPTIESQIPEVPAVPTVPAAPAVPAVPAVPAFPGTNSGRPPVNGPSANQTPQPVQEPAEPLGPSAAKPYSRRISQIGFRSSAQAAQNPRPLTARDPLQGIPVAEHPTQWSRPAAPQTGSPDGR